MSRIRSWIRDAQDALAGDTTLRRVLKNTGWLTGSSGVVIVLSTIQGVLTARLLGVVLWGVLGIAASFAAVIGPLLSFRMNDFVVKWITQFREQDPRLAPTAFKLALAGDIGTAVLSFIVVELLASWGATAFAKNPELVWVFRIVGCTALLQVGRESFIGMLHINRDFHIQSLLQVISQAVSVVGIVVVFVIHGGLLGVVVVVVGVQAITAVLFFIYGLRAANAMLGAGWALTPLERPGEIGREMWHFAIMVNISGTLRTVMNDGDLLILGFLAGPTPVAYYKLAKNICQIAQLPMMPMVNASYPEFSSAAAQGEWVTFRRLIRRGSKVAAAWVIPVSFALVVASPFAIRLLYGPSFVPAVPALAVLLIGFSFDSILFWTGAGLLSMGEAGYVTSVILAATLVKVALAFLLVPTGGYIMLAALQSVTLAAANLLYSRRVFVGIRARELAAAA